MKNIAVILSGCGVYDGSEIHEAALLMLAIDKMNANYVLFAPNVTCKVVNHLTGQETDEKRNVMVESARIARGQIQDMLTFNASEFDALILPGGYGAAKNLSTYAFDGANMEVNIDVEKAIKDMYRMRKPIGAMCIAPVVLAKVLGHDIAVTIGTSQPDACNIEKMGGVHQNAGVTEVIVDRQNNIVTTPCYMTATRISEVAEGSENMMKAIFELLS